MVIDDLHDFRMFHPVNGLGELIVIHKHHAETRICHEVHPCHHSGDPVVRVKNNKPALDGPVHNPQDVAKRLFGAERGTNLLHTG